MEKFVLIYATFDYEAYDMECYCIGIYNSLNEAHMSMISDINMKMIIHPLMMIGGL